MHVILVHSPTAGDGEHDRRSLLRLLDAAGHEARYFSSKDEGWRAPVAAGDAELVAVAGGDGTVAEVARAVRDPRVPIAVLPGGTANNIATGLGIASVPVEALVARWPNGRRQPFDIGVARWQNETFRFVESIGVGLLADAMHAIDSDPAEVEHLADAEDRVAVAIDIHRRLLASQRTVRIDLQLDGTDHSGDYLLLEILNFGLAGPNLRLAPDADPADGRFDVVLVSERQRAELAQELARYRAGETSAAPRLPTVKASRIRLAFGDRRIHLDDEMRTGSGSDGPGSGIDVSIEPGAVTFLI
jgi:diacylglycerol kinase (ATP)